MSEKDQIHKKMLSLALKNAPTKHEINQIKALALVLIANAMHIPTLGVPAANQPEPEEFTTPEGEKDGLLHKPDGSVMGFLLDAGHGIFEPTLGKVSVSPDRAAAHNRALSRAQIKGLEDCKIGEGGTFYYDEGANTVNTWTGEKVSRVADITRRGKKIMIGFQFKGMEFEGWVMKGGSCFPFKRIL